MSSSLLIGKNKNQQESADSSGEFNELFDCGFGLLLTGRCAEAYRLFTKAAKLKKNAGLLFNLSLCSIAANDYSTALTLIEEAERELKQIGSSENVLPDSAEKALATLQNQSSSYRQPMERRFLHYFSDLAEDRILQLKVDIYLKLEMWSKLTELCLRLQAKNYPNVTEALQIASKANPIT